MDFKKIVNSLRGKGLITAGGVVVGILAFLLIFKLLTPIGRTVCKIMMQDAANMGFQEGREVDVEATPVKFGNISRRIVTVGRLKADHEIVVKSEVSGKIAEIGFEEGSTVEEGSLLFRFDDEDTKASLKQAEAEHALHSAEFDRTSSLHSKNIQSTKQLEEIRAKRDIAEAKVEEIKATLAKKTIRAPFAGRIGLMTVSVGAYVQAGQDLVTLVDSMPIKVDFKVPEKHIHDIGAGQVAEVTLEAFKDQIFRFNVDAVNSKVDELSHSIALRASNPNEGELLRAGLFASVSLIIGEKSDAILVPETSVFRQGDVEFVWIVNKGKASRTRVITGTREDGKIEILPTYLRPGMIVITAGQIRVSEGTRVRITNMNMPDAPGSAAPQDPAAVALDALAKKPEAQATTAPAPAEQPEAAPAATPAEAPNDKPATAAGG